MTQTHGQYRVGTGFNPSNNLVVKDIKEAAAALIDQIDAIGDGVSRDKSRIETMRLISLAKTAIEEGAMWAVKAATKPAPQE